MTENLVEMSETKYENHRGEFTSHDVNVRYDFCWARHNGMFEPLNVRADGSRFALASCWGARLRTCGLLAKSVQQSVLSLENWDESLTVALA